MNEPSKQDVDALADVISRMYGSPTDPDDHLPDHCRAMARAILASDWFAHRSAEAHRDGAAAALDEASDHQYAVAAGLRGWLRGRASLIRRGDA